MTSICATCAVFNVFGAFFSDFAKEAFVIVGNTVTVLVFGFMVGAGILRYALRRLAPHLGKDSAPRIDLVQLVVFLASVGALRVADVIVWRTYDAMMDWGAGVTIQLIEKGSGGAMVVPAAARTPIAQIVGGAESLLWGFVQFAFEALSAPNFFTALTTSPGSIVISVVFGALVLLVYGGLLLYFAYIILQAFIFLLLPIPFGSLIVACAAFKETRQVTIEAVRLVISGLGTFVAAGIAMGLTGRILDLSKSTVACYLDTRSAESCAGQVASLADAVGVPAGALKEAFSSFELFTVLIVLGACCWIVHFLTQVVTARLLGVQPLAGPLSVFAATTAGTIYMGARQAFAGGKQAISLGQASLSRGFAGEMGRDPLRMDSRERGGPFDPMRMT
ncbi:MAG: hypothetical protein ACM31L_08485 [Actinomycetota bacterium]